MRCHCSCLGQYCGARSIPGWKTSICLGHSQKIKRLHIGVLLVFILLRIVYIIYSIYMIPSYLHTQKHVNRYVIFFPPAVIVKKMLKGFPQWHSRLRIWHCHCSNSVAVVAHVPSVALELPHAAGTAKMEKKKFKSIALKGTELFYLISVIMFLSVYLCIYIYMFLSTHAHLFIHIHISICT